MLDGGVVCLHHGSKGVLFIDPGKPMQNASIESFNGRFREECHLISFPRNWYLTSAGPR
jgi:transposase InsO family protein